VSDVARPNVVAFQGELGAFSEEAAQICGGENVVPLPRATFSDVVQAVLSGAANSGILPVENSLIGPIIAANEALSEPGVKIVRELTLPIHQCLLAKSGATITSVHKVLSHPAALGQCKAFFATHSHLVAEAFYDTAGAAKHVANIDDTTLAAIASRRAAKRYGLAILAENIEDRGGNRTRFAMFVYRNDLVMNLQQEPV
jgi:prephenate dehydratase